MKAYIQNARARVFVPPISGFLFYGAWAVWVNHAHGWYDAITAGLTQGSYSFFITLIIAMFIEHVFVYLANIPLRSLWVFLVTALLITLTSFGVNYLTGTPEIMLTVLPGLMVSLVYTVIYIIALNKTL